MKNTKTPVSEEQLPGVEMPEGGLVNVLTQQPIDNEELKQVAKLAKELSDWTKKVAILEDLLEQGKEKLREFEMVLVPDAMAAIGLDEIKLTTGQKIIVSPFYSGSIPPNEGDKADPIRRQGCFDWLRKNKFDAIIKTEVKVAAGKGDSKLVEKVTKLLMKAKVPFVQADGVHHMTLKAFIKEQAEAGAPPPADLFNTFIGKKAQVK